MSEQVNFSRCINPLLIITPLKYHVFENIMENAPFSIFFQKNSKLKIFLNFFNVV